MESKFRYLDAPSHLDDADMPLYAWAKKMRRQGDPRGKWLKSKFVWTISIQEQSLRRNLYPR